MRCCLLCFPVNVDCSHYKRRYYNRTPTNISIPTLEHTKMDWRKWPTIDVTLRSSSSRNTKWRDLILNVSSYCFSSWFWNVTDDPGIAQQHRQLPVSQVFVEGIHAQFRTISQVVPNATRKRSETRKGRVSKVAALSIFRSSHNSFSQASPLLTQLVSHRWRQESLDKKSPKASPVGKYVQIR